MSRKSNSMLIGLILHLANHNVNFNRLLCGSTENELRIIESILQ